MKKVLRIITMALVLVLLTGCGVTKSNNGATTPVEKPAKGNCNVFDCIKKLDIKDDLATVNKVMGFNGEVVREGTGYSTYEWVIDEDKNEKVEATFYSTSTTISISFKDEAIKNSKVDFSKFDEIKKAMNNKETVTYDDVKAKFGADGVLTEKSSFSNKYRWVNDKGGYMTANFGTETGKCTMIIGRA